jgi:hypothetical protein
MGIFREVNCCGRTVAASEAKMAPATDTGLDKAEHFARQSIDCQVMKSEGAMIAMHGRASPTEGHAPPRV